MLDRVLERRRGLPILLSAVYVEVARRADVPLAGVGLPGHYVVGHFGGAEPLLLDPFNGGVEVTGDAPAALVRPWSPHGPPCACSTTSSRRSRSAVISRAHFAPPNCDSRFRPGPTSATACVPSSPRSAHGSTEPGPRRDRAPQERGGLGRARNAQWVPDEPADELVRVLAQCPEAGQQVRPGTGGGASCHDDNELTRRDAAEARPSAS